MAITLKDRLIELAMLGVSAGGTGAAFGWFLRFGFKEDDVFAFFGALVGAALTVWGAVWLTERTEKNARRFEVGLLRDSFSAAHERIHALIKAAPGTNMPWPEEYRSGLHHSFDPIQEVEAIASEALHHGTRLTFRERVRVSEVLKAARYFTSLYADRFRSEKNVDLWDERSWDEALGSLWQTTQFAIWEFDGDRASQLRHARPVTHQQ